jgi:hypothetical protein
MLLFININISPILLSWHLNKKFVTHNKITLILIKLHSFAYCCLDNKTSIIPYEIYFINDDLKRCIKHLREDTSLKSS